MFCNKCGSEIKDSSRFCHKCGQPAGQTAEPAAQQFVPPPQQPMAYPPVQPRRKLSKGALIGIIAGAVVLAVGISVVIAVAALSVKDKADAEANRRTCLANQRTVDGALQSYSAIQDDGAYPDSLEEMAEPGEFQVLKKVPTCPSGPKPYVLIDDEVPWISCPNDATHEL